MFLLYNILYKIKKEIKMSKTNLKVNDWGISTSWINQEPRQITKIELATCQDEEDFVFFRENWCVELKYIQKWIPEPGCGVEMKKLNNIKDLYYENT